MTGSALFDFLITIVVVAGVVALFFAVIDKVSPDASFSKIAKIAIGLVALVLVLLACKAVLFGGGAPGATLNGRGLLEFACASIVVLLLLYLVNLALDWFGAAAGLQPWAAAIKYVIAALALIALLVVAGDALFGYGPPGADALRGPIFGTTPRIIR